MPLIRPFFEGDTPGGSLLSLVLTFAVPSSKKTLEDRVLDTTVRYLALIRHSK